MRKGKRMKQSTGTTSIKEQYKTIHNSSLINSPLSYTQTSSLSLIDCKTDVVEKCNVLQFLRSVIKWFITLSTKFDLICNFCFFDCTVDHSFSSQHLFLLTKASLMRRNPWRRFGLIKDKMMCLLTRRYVLDTRSSSRRRGDYFGTRRKFLIWCMSVVNPGCEGSQARNEEAGKENTGERHKGRHKRPSKSMQKQCDSWINVSFLCFFFFSVSSLFFSHSLMNALLEKTSSLLLCCPCEVNTASPEKAEREVDIKKIGRREKGIDKRILMIMLRWWCWQWFTHLMLCSWRRESPVEKT